LRAVAHPTRRLLLALTWDRPVPAGELVDALGLAPASVSEHLKVLRKCQLVVLHRDGTWRRYQADAARVAALARWLARFPGTP
jgi:DNA-binding transcriptional ArsR family regulator